ncbi:MAG: hypothetical protein FJ311_11305 [Rhodospirillales bacterium]|nr:hypothetical protein [Rhodospirillales bacterium]
MSIPLADVSRRAARALVLFCCRHAKSVLAAALLLTAASGAYFAMNFRVNTDTTDMLNPELPFRKLSREVSRAFPQFSDNILVVVEGDTSDLADDAAHALAARLRERPELFGRVMDQAGDPFFRRHGLLFKSVDDLSDLGDRLARAQPFLGALWRDHTLRGLAAMLDLAAEEILKDPVAAPIEIGTALDAISDVIEAQRDGRFKQLSWQDVMSGEVSAPKDRRRFLLIQPLLDNASLAPAGKAMSELRRIARDAGLVPERGVSVRLTGSAALNHEELKAVESSVGLASLLSLAVVAAIVFGGLRSLRMGVAIVVALVMGLVWTASVGIALFGELNLLSVTFVVLFVGLSVDFGIHFCLRFVERRAQGEAAVSALADGGGDVGAALALSAIATAIGFFAFAPTDYRGLAQLGVIAGVGMFVALVTNLTVVPALIALFGTTARLARRFSAATESPGGKSRAYWSGLIRHHRGLAIALAIVAVFGGAAASRTTFDFDPLNLKAPKAESVRVLRALQDDGQAGRYAATVLAKDPSEAEVLARRFAELPEVDETRSILDFEPKRQPEKLDLIADMALFLMPALEGEKRADPPTEPELRAAFLGLADRLVRLAAIPGGEAASSAGRLAGLLRGHVLGPAGGGAERWRDLDARLLASLPGRLEVLKQALGAGPVTLADFPEELRRQYVAPDGRVRLEIVPRDDLRDQEALRRFVGAIRTVTPAVTGSPVVLYESGRAIVGAFAEATALALAAIVTLLYATLRRFRDVLLALLPAALATILTGAFSVLAAIPLNYANVIVLPLLFGMSVVYGIHLVLRARAAENLAAALASSTPRAMALSAMTTIASFASIALAEHWGMASLGILLTAAMILTLASALVALPVAMAVFMRRYETPSV